MNPMETGMLYWEWTDKILISAILLLMAIVMVGAWVLLKAADAFLSFLNRRGPR